MPDDVSGSSYRVVLESDPTPGDLAAVSQGLTAFNRARTGIEDYQSLTLLLRDASDTLAGGLVGATYWGWLYVDMLWIRPESRRQGGGDVLLSTAEGEAVRRGCAHAYLDTFSFQALPFYQKHGYAVFGELPDFPAGQSRYFLTKKLTPESP